MPPANSRLAMTALAGGSETEAFRARAAHSEWSIVAGKLHTLKGLHTQPPEHLIPNHIVRLRERYRNGEISRERERERWYNARRKLRLYGLLDEPRAKRPRIVSAAESHRRWRHKHGRGLCATLQHDAPQPPPTGESVAAVAATPRPESQGAPPQAPEHANPPTRTLLTLHFDKH